MIGKIERIKNLTSELKIAYVDNIFNYSDSFKLSCLKKILMDKQTYYTVINDSKIIGGYATYKNYLQYLFVVPDYRRLGIALDIVNELLHKYNTLYMHIRDDNTAMLNLINHFEYEKIENSTIKRYDGKYISLYLVKI